MKNSPQKLVSIFGMVVGVAVVIIGLLMQNTSTYSVGEYIKFGADFYTEIYSVTRDVGHAINYAINDLICALGWLVVSIGAIDICLFAYKFAGTLTASKKADDFVAPVAVNNVYAAQPIQNEIVENPEQNTNETPVAE